MKFGDVICVEDSHDLCPRQARNFVEKLSWTLSRSRRNGILALLGPVGGSCFDQIPIPCINYMCTTELHIKASLVDNTS